MPSRKAQELIGYTCNDRDQNNTADDPEPDGVHADHHKEQDTDDHNDHDKAGAAALMLLGAGPYIIHGQFQPVFYTVDTLVLRAVVHERPLYILHP